MEMWELFLKGLSKTIEEFVVTMVERGKELEGQEPSKRPVSPQHEEEPIKTAPKKRTIPYRELGELEDQILSVIAKYPEGITLKEVASEMGMQWHFLRIPMRQLTMEDKITKNEKLYTLAGQKPAPGHDPKHAPEMTMSDEPVREPEQFKAPVVQEAPARQLEIEPLVTAVEEEKPQPVKPRRRVVDAKTLEKKPAVSNAADKMSVRDRERLRYRILTALRGRPEGLTLEKLAAVLGMEFDILVPNLDQLSEENKIKNINGKYSLP